MKKRNTRAPRENEFTFTIRVASDEERRPQTRRYSVDGLDVQSMTKLYEAPAVLDERGRTYTLRGSPFFEWRETARTSGNRSDRREAHETFLTALGCALVGIERIDMTPLPVVAGMPDVQIRMRDGTEAYVEVTQARTSTDSYRQAMIREIGERVQRLVEEERIQIAGSLDFSFSECPRERDLDSVVNAVMDCVRDPASWPKAGATVEPASPDLSPYCRIGFGLPAEEQITFSSDMARLEIVDPRDVVRATLDRKRSAHYDPRPLWLIVDAVLPMGGTTSALYREDEPLGQFDRIIVYDGFRMLMLEKMPERESSPPSVETDGQSANGTPSETATSAPRTD